MRAPRRVHAVRDTCVSRCAAPTKNGSTRDFFPMSEPVIRAQNLSKIVRSGDTPLTILDGVSFEVAGGATVAIVGASGSGKTTLLGLLAGLDRPTTGEVWLGDTALNGLSEDARAALRRRWLGFVFQSFQLLPALTALENVMLPGRKTPRRALANGLRASACRRG